MRFGFHEQQLGDAAQQDNRCLAGTHAQFLFDIVFQNSVDLSLSAQRGRGQRVRKSPVARVVNICKAVGERILEEPLLVQDKREGGRRQTGRRPGRR